MFIDDSKITSIVTTSGVLSNLDNTVNQITKALDEADDHGIVKWSARVIIFNDENKLAMYCVGNDVPVKDIELEKNEFALCVLSYSWIKDGYIEGDTVVITYKLTEGDNPKMSLDHIDYPHSFAIG